MSKPLWEVMRDAYDTPPLAPVDADDDWTDRYGYAAEIRAIAEWIEQRQVADYAVTLPDVREVIGWLTAEAGRAESANQSTVQDQQ